MKIEKRLFGNITAAVMGVLYAAVSVFMLSRINSLPAASWIFHVGAEYFCLTSILVIFVWHIHNGLKEEETKRRYAELCAILFVTLSVDIVAWVVDGQPGFYFVEYVTNLLLYLLIFVHGAKFVLFAFSLVKNQNEGLDDVKRSVMRLMNVQFVFRVIILFTGGYFYMDEAGFSQNGPMLGIGYSSIALVIIFVCGAVAGAGVSGRKVLQVLSYPLGVLGMLLVNLIDREYANGLVGITLSMIFLYFSMSLDAGEGRENLDRNFKRYLSDDVVKHLTSDDRAVEPGGSTQYVTMVFCQLHRFGKLTESMEPEKVVDILNGFYAEMLEVVTTAGGTLLEFPGYGIFCIFGAYEENSDHATIAVDAAFRMQESMETINARNRERRYPELAIGIGINTGDVVLGSVGSKDHMRFTAISSNVNLASRIETYAGDGDILVSQTTMDQSGNILESEKVCTVIPKGISNPIDIYKVISIRK